MHLLVLIGAGACHYGESCELAEGGCGGPYACQSNNDCPADSLCYVVSGECLRAIACAKDADCGDSRLYCRAFSQRCEYLNACTSDSVCTESDSDLTCDTVAAHCVRADGDGDSE